MMADMFRDELNFHFQTQGFDQSRQFIRNDNVLIGNIIFLSN